MRVFVAGAAGAVGRHLIPLLVERGHSVVALPWHSESKRDLGWTFGHPSWRNGFASLANAEATAWRVA